MAHAPHGLRPGTRLTRRLLQTGPVLGLGIPLLSTSWPHAAGAMTRHRHRGRRWRSDRHVGRRHDQPECHRHAWQQRQRGSPSAAATSAVAGTLGGSVTFTRSRTQRASIEADLRERVAGSAFHSWMGMELVRAEPGRVEIGARGRRSPPEPPGSPARRRDRNARRHGHRIGGADDGAGPAAAHVTVQLDVHYLRARRARRSRPSGPRCAWDLDRIRGGRRHRRAGRLLARATATVAVMADHG